MFGGHSRKKIDFIGIGAGKAGTTWLWHGLRQHPGIFMPDQKELHYFNMISFEDDKIRNPRFDQPLSWYLDYFSAALPSQICGRSRLFTTLMSRLRHAYSIAILRRRSFLLFAIQSIEPSRSFFIGINGESGRLKILTKQFASYPSSSNVAFMQKH